MDTSAHEYGTGASSTGYGHTGDGHGQANLLESLKSVLAEKLHEFSETVGHASERIGEPTISGKGRQAAHWLEESSSYVKDFDYKKADAQAREYVRRNPGRSLLIAGAVGLVIGALCARR